jgi:hypothetical protein
MITYPGRQKPNYETARTQAHTNTIYVYTRARVCVSEYLYICICMCMYAMNFSLIENIILTIKVLI